MARSAQPSTGPFVTIVSGLPRSGTSLMMQMLHAGGMPVLTDRVRTADQDNPRGYFELEAVKQVKSNRDWLTEAVGKAVKIIHLLLMELPQEHDYRVIFMRRDLSEVLKSQGLMLERSGKAGAALSAEKLAAVYEGQLATVTKWLDAQPNFRVHRIEYAAIIRDPLEQSRSVARFLNCDLDVDAMAAAVNPGLYRNRS
jgi:hypothetical protein